MLSNDETSSLVMENTGPQLLRLTPAEEVIFQPGGNGQDLVARVNVANVAGNPVAFKIKTTSPEKFRVRPSMACLGPNGTLQIEIVVQAANNPSQLVRDKFLISASTVDHEGLSHAQISEIMKVRTAEQHSFALSNGQFCHN